MSPKAGDIVNQATAVAIGERAEVLLGIRFIY
jgi:hypothetical protein